MVTSEERRRFERLERLARELQEKENGARRFDGARLTGRWLVARNEQGNPRYSLIVEQSPTFVAYLSPSGTRRITSVAGVQRIVESGKAVLA